MTFSHTLRFFSIRSAVLFGIGAGLLVGCAMEREVPEFGQGQDEPYVSHEEQADFEVDPAPDGKQDSISPERFDPNLIVTEAFFADATDLTGDDLQRFFEDTPYGRRSFLADETVDGRRAADVIVEMAKQVGINPLIFLARMQVEKSLVSRATRPSSSTIKHALGCGCPDGRSCYRAYEGLGNQVRCAGEILDKLYDQSVDGTGEWRAGKGRRTSDHVWVKPVNHATAALYGYTPWVLRGRGGNWLVWNVTRKFALHAVALGLIPPPQQEPWVGTPCEKDEDCRFVADRRQGACFRFPDLDGTTQGFCTLPCEGTCPDRSGRARTFCVETPEGGAGMCVSKSSYSRNHNCKDVAGTSALELDRYVGSSGVSPSTSVVCWPESYQQDP